MDNMKIELLSVNDKHGLDRVYILLNSIKQTKRAQTQIHYNLILEDCQNTKEWFTDLISQDFQINFIQLTPFLDKINLPQTTYCAPANKYTMIRCLAPNYFSSIDKMLYLDTDTVFLQEGIEQLWETDITDYYMAGCEDVIITRLQRLQIERQNTKNSTHYINGGVILFNYEKIREDKLDLKLLEMCNEWNLDELKPYWLDQTLMNYVFRQKIKLIDYKYNDFSLVTSDLVYPVLLNYLKQKYGYQNVVNSVKDAVILHFLGDNKPWRDDQKVKSLTSYPYRSAVKEVWSNIEKNLKKD